MREHGFTLLELIVSVALFALMSAMAYSGLSAIVNARAGLAEEARELAGLQKAFALMGRDIEQAAAREIRGEYGEKMPAMIWRGLGDSVFEFSRGGSTNPAGRKRSSLLRIGYRVEDGILFRKQWMALDRMADDDAFESEMLRGVNAMEIKLYHGEKGWMDAWPPEKLANESDEKTRKKLPRAVAIELDIEGVGKISRIFLVAGNT